MPRFTSEQPTIKFLAGLKGILKDDSLELDKGIQCVRINYSANGHSCTPTEIATKMNYSGYRGVNGVYGRFVIALGNAMGFPGLKDLSLVAEYSENARGEVVYTLWPNFIAAAVKCGLLDGPSFASSIPPSIEYPDEVATDGEYWEGAVTQRTVNQYERNREARNECVAICGATCAACGCNFGQRYGPRGEGFIHVHHLRPLSTIKEGYRVVPEADLVPACPNCHAMLHVDPPISIEELRETLRANGVI